VPSSNAQEWALVVGFLLPLVMSVINQPGWSGQVKSLLAFAASALAGVGTLYFAQHSDKDVPTWISTALLILVTAQASYHGFHKPTGIAPTIEAKTSPSTSAQP
jgi:hypothetical protein